MKPRAATAEALTFAHTQRVGVLLIVIDAASPRVVNPAIQTGRLPNLQRIASWGSLHQGSVTIFPSITPAATSSIVTGTYPSEHGIAAASWFDESRNEVAYRSHQVGPHAALPVVERVDSTLGEMFDAARGFERFIRGTTVIVTSDHGHCEVLPDRDRAAIQLDAVLSEFRQADIGRAWRSRDEIMICPNMRAAQITIATTAN